MDEYSIHMYLSIILNFGSKDVNRFQETNNFNWQIGNFKGIFGNMAKSLDEWIGVSSYNEKALYYRHLGHKFMNLAIKEF